MRIAVNTRFLLHQRLEGIGTFSHQVLQRLVVQHPEHQFIFMFDRPWHESFIYADNVIPLAVFPPARHPILYYWWFEWAIPAAMKKHKADLFFSPDGYLSLRADLPQIAVIHDLAFEHFPKDVSRMEAAFYRYFFPKYANKSKHILTVSQYSKSDIEKIYKLPSDKIKVVYNGADTGFGPVEEVAKETSRKTYSQGLPYFLYVGALHQRKNIVRLLNAFLFFLEENLKDQKPIYPLVIVGRKAWGTAEMDEVFQSSDLLQKWVSFTGRLDDKELMQVTASAFCHINVSYFEGFGIPVLESLQSGVPAIVSQDSALSEVGGNAALTVDPLSIPQITSALHTMQDDPKRYQTLAANSISQAEKFSWDKTTKLVWEEIERAI